MLQITAERTGQPVERLREDSLRDKWFTAEEARDYGFVDAVLTDVRAVTPAHRTTIGLAGDPEAVAAR
jgi:ATP-dependent Clp protease protease subunit